MLHGSVTSALSLLIHCYVSSEDFVANNSLLLVKYHSCSLLDHDPYILTDLEILSCKSDSLWPSSTAIYLCFISSEVISWFVPSIPLILPGLPALKGAFFYGDELKVLTKLPCLSCSLLA